MTTVELLLLCNTVLLTLIWVGTWQQETKEFMATYATRMTLYMVGASILLAIVILVDTTLFGGVIFD
jgi:hypothetical protein